MDNHNKHNRPLSPHLQVYKIQITSLLSIMHRGTGIVLYAGAVLCTLWFLMLAKGPESYERLRDFLFNPMGLIFLIGLTFSFFYHFFNGIRHLCWDMGVGYELTTMRKTGWTVVFLSFFLTTITWIIGLMQGEILP